MPFFSLLFSFTFTFNILDAAAYNNINYNEIYTIMLVSWRACVRRSATANLPRT